MLSTSFGKNFLEVQFVTVKAFYPLLLIVSYKLSIPFNPLFPGGVSMARGHIVVSCEFQYLCVARVMDRYFYNFRSD